MELFENLAYEIGDVLYKKNHPGMQKAKGYVDSQASNFLGKKIIEKVKSHANVVTWAGLASAIPGGELASGGAIVASTWKMYYDINKEIGISFSDNFLKSVASGIASNLASNGVAFAATAVVNKIPLIGNVVGAVAGPAINRTALYTAAGCYLKALKTILNNDDISESAFKAALSGDGNESIKEDTSDDGYSSQDELYQRVVRIFVKILGVSPNEVTPHANIRRDLGADSLDAVELTMEFEKQFNIRIPDDVAERMTQVKDIVSYLRRHC